MSHLSAAAQDEDGETIARLLTRIDELTDQRGEMLTALRYIEGLALADEIRDLPTILQTASAAIAKATGGQG